MKFKKFRDFSSARQFFTVYAVMILAILLLPLHGLNIVVAGIQSVFFIVLLALHLIFIRRGTDMFSEEKEKDTKTGD